MFLFNRDKGFENISIQDYSDTYVENKTDHMLVDVRTKSEYTDGHLPNAINIPLNELDKRMNEIPTDKPIIVVCASGNRSKSGASKLVSAGYTNISNLKGGTMRWMMSGKPIES